MVHLDLILERGVLLRLCHEHALVAFLVLLLHVELLGGVLDLQLRLVEPRRHRVQPRAGVDERGLEGLDRVVADRDLLALAANRVGEGLNVGERCGVVGVVRGGGGLHRSRVRGLGGLHRSRVHGLGGLRRGFELDADDLLLMLPLGDGLVVELGEGHGELGAGHGELGAGSGELARDRGDLLLVGVQGREDLRACIVQELAELEFLGGWLSGERHIAPVAPAQAVVHARAGPE
mmetsp:Transcript_37238/g.87312  ORF Transcript_37238/g.87312 Transcript_37238/m.87312 type:complete len:234 (+) Transcript_37238:524-1225(+)